MDLQSIKNRFGIIGNSPALNHALSVAAQVANTDLSVLITGESGVGKEAFSQVIHAMSARKHNPFISYVNIQKNPKRCKNIVNAAQFDKDAASGSLPEYVFYVPNDKNSGHDTGVAYADKWYSGKFSKYISNPKFMKDTVLISTFDESSGGAKRNHIYTSIVGTAVTPGVYATDLNLYSLLKLVEDNWNLGNLGRNDETAAAVPDIWK